MVRTMLAGAAVAAALCGTAQAAGPMAVTTDFPTSVFAGDPFKANLAGIGVGVELASPTFVNVFAPADLTFRLLQSGESASGIEITSLTVDGTTHAFGPQAFSPSGTLLGVHTLSGSFTDLVGFHDAASDPESPPLPWPEAIQVYILTEDEPNLSGIGPFIGNFDTLYFSIAGAALFEVTSASGVVPEPATWALMIGGFALAGGAIRRRRGPQAASRRPKNAR